MDDYPEFPDFLRISAEDRRRAWEGRTVRKLTREANRAAWTPKSLEPAGRALEKALERERAAEQKSRLAALKERRKR